MPCYKPRDTWCIGSTPKGKQLLTFKKPEKPWQHNKVTVPCGQCIGCRLERSRQWAMRCMHEASLYDDNCFITLTYNDENLPPLKSLRVEDFQKFMKRLRKQTNNKIRFMHCGEYGEQTGRPHYHAILFNYDFKDREQIGISKATGEPLYTSAHLQSIWSIDGEDIGHVQVGDCTFESAAYVARYITKKVLGTSAESEDERFRQYAVVDFATGEIQGYKEPEYSTMSRGGRTKGTNLGGIGRQWIDKYMYDVYPRDEIAVRGINMKPPKYYDSQYEIVNIDEHIKVKERRLEAAKIKKEDNTKARLKVREQVKLAQFNQLKRQIK